MLLKKLAARRRQVLLVAEELARFLLLVGGRGRRIFAAISPIPLVIFAVHWTKNATLRSARVLLSNNEFRLFRLAKINDNATFPNVKAYPSLVFHQPRLFPFWFAQKPEAAFFTFVFLVVVSTRYSLFRVIKIVHGRRAGFSDKQYNRLFFMSVVN